MGAAVGRLVGPFALDCVGERDERLGRLGLEVEDLGPARGSRERQVEGGSAGHELGQPSFDLPEPLGLDEGEEDRDVRRDPGRRVERVALTPLADDRLGLGHPHEHCRPHDRRGPSPLV
jgi:hypothetical protein